ncbi:GntR family transcriptional regulator, partial [Acinetobacter baumannii]
GLRRSDAVHETVAREIGKAIVSGRLQPGDPLVAEERYSAETGTSRTAYREAIRLLAGKGLVYSRTKSGTRVTEQIYWSMLDVD